MGQLIAFLLVVFLLVAGWNQSFKEHYMRLTGHAQDSPAVVELAPTPVPVPVVRTEPSPPPQVLLAQKTPVPTATPVSHSGDWMNQPTGMDKPYKTAGHH